MLSPKTITNAEIEIDLVHFFCIWNTLVASTDFPSKNIIIIRNKGLKVRKVHSCFMKNQPVEVIEKVKRSIESTVSFNKLINQLVFINTKESTSRGPRLGPS